jgi:hypothetical protein
MSQIQAATIERDEGYWTHPDFPEWDEGTTRLQCDTWCAENDGKFYIVSFEDDAPENLIERFYDDGESDISDWNPICEKPDSFLLSIHDTEDGPVALFFAPNNNGGAA